MTNKENISSNEEDLKDSVEQEQQSTPESVGEVSAEQAQERAGELDEKARAEIGDAESEIGDLKNKEDLQPIHSEQIKEQLDKLGELKKAEESLRNITVWFNPKKKKEIAQQLEMIEMEIEGTNMDIINLEKAENKSANERAKNIAKATEALESFQEYVREAAEDGKVSSERAKEISGIADVTFKDYED